MIKTRLAEQEMNSERGGGGVALREEEEEQSSWLSVRQVEWR